MSVNVNVIYAQGTVDVSVPASEKIAVYTDGSARVSSVLGYPNFPSTVNDLGEVENEQTVFGTFSSTAATTIRIEATSGAPVSYVVGTAPVVPVLQSVGPNRPVNLYRTNAPVTATDTASLTDAQMLSGLIVATPTAAAAYTVRTGTQLKAALPAGLAAGDTFNLTIINLGGTGDDITLTAATDITIVGNAVVGPTADVATEQEAQATFAFRYVTGVTFVAYRIA
jgi:hypothetical protein